MINRPESIITIVGSCEFGLTEEDVRVAYEEAKQNLELAIQKLNHPDKKTREVINDMLPRLRAQENALSASSEEVLARIRGFYDRAVELERSGLIADQLASSMGDEFPELMDYYGLLRTRPWGYRLGQSVCALQARPEKPTT